MRRHSTTACTIMAAPSSSEGAAGASAPRTRLIITHMTLENFKSYAGVQQIGPFHKVSAGRRTRAADAPFRANAAGRRRCSGVRLGLLRGARPVPRGPVRCASPQPCGASALHACDATRASERDPRATQCACALRGARRARSSHAAPGSSSGASHGGLRNRARPFLAEVLLGRRTKRQRQVQRH